MLWPEAVTGRRSSFLLMFAVCVALACAAERRVRRTPTPGRPTGPPAPETPPEPPVVEPQPPPPEPLRAWSAKEERRIKSVQRHVKKASGKHGVPASLINGIIWIESKFKPWARGREGPRGLMQLMPRTSRALARELRRKHRPYSASFSIDAGTYYFSKLIKRFDGNLRLALAAYKQGPASIKDLMRRGEPLPGCSQRYIQRVLTAADAFVERLGGEEERPRSAISAAPPK